MSQTFQEPCGLSLWNWVLHRASTCLIVSGIGAPQAVASPPGTGGACSKGGGWPSRLGRSGTMGGVSPAWGPPGPTSTRFPVGTRLPAVLNPRVWSLTQYLFFFHFQRRDFLVNSSPSNCYLNFRFQIKDTTEKQYTNTSFWDTRMLSTTNLELIHAIFQSSSILFGTKKYPFMSFRKTHHTLESRFSLQVRQ